MITGFEFKNPTSNVQSDNAIHFFLSSFLSKEAEVLIYRITQLVTAKNIIYICCDEKKKGIEEGRLNWPVKAKQPFEFFPLHNAPVTQELGAIVGTDDVVLYNILKQKATFFQF